MKTKITMLFVLNALITPATAETVTYTRFGNNTFGSDGSVITEFNGNTFVTVPDNQSRRPAESYVESRDARDWIEDK